MAITLIPHTYSIEVQLSDYTLHGYIRRDTYGGLTIVGDIFYMEQELEDLVRVGADYTPTLQRFYFQLYTNNQPVPPVRTTGTYGTSLYIPPETPLHFFLYPCRPNTEYTVYERQTGAIGTVTTAPETTAYNKMYAVDDSLTFDEKLANAELIRTALDNAGWTPEAIAGVLGVMMCQSNLNPANIGYHYNGTPYTVHNPIAYWGTLTTLMRADCETIPYQTDITETPHDPYWIYGAIPRAGQSIPDWTPISPAGDVRPAISIDGDGFGLLGINPFDRYLLFPQSTQIMFPAGNYWSGESQVQWLDHESRFNLYWYYSFNDHSLLPEEYYGKTFTEYRTMKETPETMAHIFLAHKADYLGNCYRGVSVDKYTPKLECAKQWARYFYKPKKHKKHNMPIWEYLRYTI